MITGLYIFSKFILFDSSVMASYLAKYGQVITLATNI